MENTVYDSLLEDMKQGLGKRRYEHVRSVYEECGRLADMFDLNGKTKNDLLISAILHDITKPFDREIGQLTLAESLDLPLSEQDKESPKTVHAITGAALARKCYPDQVNDEVYECIRWHCTGKANMSLPEMLLYLADYIEPTREFDDCITVRNFFIQLTDEGEDPYMAVVRAMLLSFDITIKQLIDGGECVHPNSLSARNFLLNIVKKRDIIV